MASLVYSGPHAAVEVPDAGIVANRDEPIDVLEVVAKRLLKQEDWNTAETDAQKKKREDAEALAAAQEAAAEEARAKVAADAKKGK